VRPIRIERVDVAAYRIPTEAPESDGTLRWDATTLVVVEVEAGGERGLGWTYADAAAAGVVRRLLADVVRGRDLSAIGAAWSAMRDAVRNVGREGVASMAISAVDAALWDCKARLFGVPLAALLGPVRSEVPVYGSGGFTSYSTGRLMQQLAGWVEAGIPRVKMKVGRTPSRDRARVTLARRAIGDASELFVDANGAYDRKQALHFAEVFAALGVTWFEEPVSSDDVAGLRLVRDRAPGGLEISAGEYAWDGHGFRRLLEGGCVDVLQADATRCGGPSGFLVAAALCDAYGLPLSSHCAPTLHAPLGCAAVRLRHLEWFHDHVRIEGLLFDGAPQPRSGRLEPDPTRPGFGVELKRKDAERWAL
jgi:L-alanine-DL-glutamate epimerase-like enolase superfamily enzyme